LPTIFVQGKTMKLFVSLFILVFASQAFAWQEQPQLGTLFDAAGVKGTFVLLDVQSGSLRGHDQARGETRFIPASTFKLANSLIGLDSGAIKDVEQVLPYGGKPQPLPAWEHDMSLREAIKISNVPIYQELARRIGLPTMAEQVRRLGYGNGQIGTQVDRFWLDGPLTISAVEQTHFLARLAQGQLPVSSAAQAQVRDIARLQQGDGWTLYAKTGVAGSYDPDLGWWVGWVEQHGKLYSFALNIDMPHADDVGKRIELGKACLRALGLL
jgi:beta-lactamase class D